MPEIPPSDKRKTVNAVEEFGAMVLVHKKVDEVLLEIELASLDKITIMSSTEGKYQSLCPDSTKAEQFLAAVARLTAETDSVLNMVGH